MDDVGEPESLSSTTDLTRDFSSYFSEVLKAAGDIQSNIEPTNPTSASGNVDSAAKPEKAFSYRLSAISQKPGLRRWPARLAVMTRLVSVLEHRNRGARLCG